MPYKELREDRQISRTLDQIQKDIKRTKSQIRMMLYFHELHTDIPDEEWKPSDYERLRAEETKG